ncbi:hypothetical protein G9A89_011954 [Geosiphon pyriformis]|nr:hypothetical protein G9A89_011954 [Geosiphon pyriformis]
MAKETLERKHHSIPYLPHECLEKIFSFIPEDDLITLTSLLYVNREWCATVVPILWRKPITLKTTINPKIIYIYTFFLNDSIKKQLDIDMVTMKIYKNPPLFDYPSFIRELDFYKLYHLITRWSSDVSNISSFSPFYENGAEIIGAQEEGNSTKITDWGEKIEKSDWKQEGETTTRSGEKSDWKQEGEITTDWEENWSDDIVECEPANNLEVKHQNPPWLNEGDFAIKHELSYNLADESSTFPNLSWPEINEYEDPYISNEEFDDNISQESEDFYRDFPALTLNEEESVNDSDEINFGEEAERKKILFTQEICKMFFQHSPRIDYLSLDITYIRRMQPINVAEYVTQMLQYSEFKACMKRLSEFHYVGNRYLSSFIGQLQNFCCELDAIEISECEGSNTTVETAILISAQQKLRRLSYSAGYNNLSPIVFSLISQKDSLKELELARGYFLNRDPIEVLTTFQNLETLKLINIQLTSVLMLPLTHVRFPCLTTFHFVDNQYDWEDVYEEEDPPVAELKFLIEKSGFQLKEILLDVNDFFYSGTVSILALYCPNIISLTSNIQTESTIEELMDFLRSSQKLERLVIAADSWNRLVAADQVMKRLGSFLPSTMRYLDLTRWIFNAETLETFLEDCKAELSHFYWHCPADSGNGSLDVLKKWGEQHGRKYHKPQMSLSGRSLRAVYKIRVDFI